MKNMNQLKDLLRHELKDLCSAEDQIIEALPKMIDKAKHGDLKNALEKHLNVTQDQRARLDEVLTKLDEGSSKNDSHSKGKGFLSGLFSSGPKECKGMKGLIAEGEKLMGEEMTPDVLDAAIIGAAQKIEHYEIASYGTAVAYAQELNLPEIEMLLKQTLDEEYESDDLLTLLAEGGLNKEAANRSGTVRRRRSTATSQKKTTSGKTTSGKTSSRTSRTSSKSNRSKTKTS